jgi:vanillate O-demethylase monooxygenase subunit
MRLLKKNPTGDGFIMSTFEYVKDCWYPIGFSSEFPEGELQGHKIVGRPVVMWRSDKGEVVAFDDRCCHKRFPLSQSKLLDGGRLECAYHGLCYDTSGQCIAIPSQPDKAIPSQARLSVVPVKEQDGVVWIWPGNPAAAQRVAPPRTPEILDPANLSIGSPGPLRVPANYLLLIENLLDITHFYPLHDGNIGDKENSKIPVELEEGESEGYTYVKTTRHVDSYQQPPYLKEWFLYDTVERIHTHCMVTPGLTRVVMRVAPPGARIHTVASPFAGRRAQSCLALVRVVQELAQNLERPDDANGATRRGNVPGSCRTGSVGAGTPANNDGVSG